MKKILSALLGTALCLPMIVIGSSRADAASTPSAFVYGSIVPMDPGAALPTDAASLTLPSSGNWVVRATVGIGYDGPENFFRCEINSDVAQLAGGAVAFESETPSIGTGAQQITLVAKVTGAPTLTLRCLHDFATTSSPSMRGAIEAFKSADVVEDRQDGPLTLGTTKLVKTTVSSITLPVGTWHVWARNSAVNFGASDEARCELVIGTTARDKTAAQVGRRSFVPLLGSPVNTLENYAVLKVTVPTPAFQRCWHLATGPEPYVETRQIVASNLSGGLTRQTTPVTIPAIGADAVVMTRTVAAGVWQIYFRGVFRASGQVLTQCHMTFTPTGGAASDLDPASFTSFIGTPSADNLSLVYRLTTATKGAISVVCGGIPGGDVLRERILTTYAVS